MRAAVVIATALVAGGFSANVRAQDAPQPVVVMGPIVITPVAPVAASPSYAYPHRAPTEPGSMQYAPAAAAPGLSDDERRTLATRGRVRFRGVLLPGTHVESTGTDGPLVGGILLFGALWFLSALGAGAGGDGWLAIPVGGPVVEGARLMIAGTMPCSSALLCRLGQTLDEIGGVLLIIDGLAQSGGIAMIVAGAAREQRWLVLGPPPVGARARRPHWTLLPVTVGAPVGLTFAMSGW